MKLILDVLVKKNRPKKESDRIIILSNLLNDLMLGHIMNLTRILIINTIVIYLLFSFVALAKEKEYKTYTDIGEIGSPSLTIQEVISSPREFDRAILILDGFISDVEYKTFINGKKFTYFKLRDNQDNNIKVYARGYVDGLIDGSKIRIYGRYSKSKKYFFKKLKNVMKARKIQIFS